MSNRKRLHPEVQRGFYEKFRTLREVQEATIKPILDGKNVVACSGTGSGKTEAALAPLVSRYWKEFDKSDSTEILYIAPTKALVNDLDKRLRPLMELIGLRLGVRHGERDDVRRRRKLPHVIITTPESLDVMMFRGDKALETVKAMVIDEVHLLYNTQRGLHLAVLIDRLRNPITGSRKLQLVALSATIAKLKEVGSFFFGSDDMEILEFSARREIEAEVRPGDYVKVIRDRTQNEECKLLAFANDRNTCELLAELISVEADYLRGAVFTHYSNLAPKVREDIEAKFAKLKTAVCNATSTLELGIDIGDINAVLLCGVPASTDSFLQRIGRGNRRTEKTVAICFVGIGGEGPAQQNTDALRYLALINTAKTGDLSSKGTYELFGAIAQQCLSIIASRREFVSMKSLLSIFEKIPYVDRPTLERIVDGLLHLGYIRREGIKNKYGPADKLHNLVKAMRIYGNFPIEGHKVKLLNGKEPLGEVPLFNFGRRIREGSYVVFKAERWKILNIYPQAFPEFAEVEPYKGKEPCEAFSYGGTGIGFETFLNRKMWEMIHEDDFPEDLLAGEDLRKAVTEARDSVRSMCKIREIPYCALEDPRRELNFRYYTFGGSLVNRALGLITEQEDYKEDDLWLDVHAPIDWKKLPTSPEDYESILERMFRQSPDQSIFQLMLPMELQIREYTQEWLKDDAVRQVLSRLESSNPVEISLEDWPFA